MGFFILSKTFDFSFGECSPDETGEVAGEA